MRPRLLRVLLDANVLVDAQLRDLLLWAAEEGLVDVRWSDQILEEARRALTNQLGLPAENVARLLDALNRAFPHAGVADYEAILDTLTMPDPDDRHVLAAAIHGECDMLLTSNIKDFPESALPSDADLLVMRPDDGLRTLVEANPQSMAAIARRLVAGLRRPSTTLEQYIERLEQRAPIAATALGAALGMEHYERLHAQIAASEDPGSPQEAVRHLLGVLSAGDEPSVAAMVSRELGQGLTGSTNPIPTEVLKVLRLELDDVLTGTGWGFATAHRPHAPDVELVKLIPAGERPIITDGPEWARGHLFYLRSGRDGWTLVDLDGNDSASTEETVHITDLRDQVPGPALVEVPDDSAPTGPEWPAPLQLAAAFASFLDSDRNEDTLQLLVTPESLPAWRGGLSSVSIPEDMGLATGVIPAHDDGHAQVDDVCYVRFVRAPSADSTYRVVEDTLISAVVLTLQRRPELGSHFEGWRIYGMGDSVRPEDIPGRR